MAKKSKTQRAKASAHRQAKKAQAVELEAQGISAEEAAKKTEAAKQQQAKKADAKKAKPKKQRFKFFKEVKAELKRVTWPTRSEVLRWSGVVVAALVFFGVFVAVLDNLIVTPLIVALSGIGAGL
ncbi:preprotein translocase subunit SecE [Slackia faecicanis]|uniref:Protein translocase subunit SecE n=1 Tax=Slackia faecicanis TaxID=255723 RepID=A0A3N0AFP1_9ACTN|nr:preprotein translocase subunit SecE [Slackia faecicanis]MDO5358764.1 preprotein translocase subunit SecE [Slackia faecicanis]RNL19735.1 preprotein translocase subunit SecE [Slackia faecicanis]